MLGEGVCVCWVVCEDDVVDVIEEEDVDVVEDVEVDLEDVVVEVEVEVLDAPTTAVFASGHPLLEHASIEQQP